MLARASLLPGCEALALRGVCRWLGKSAGGTGHLQLPSDFNYVATGQPSCRMPLCGRDVALGACTDYGLCYTERDWEERVTRVCCSVARDARNGDVGTGRVRF